MAILATDSVKKMHSETLKQRAHKDNQLKEEATKFMRNYPKKLLKFLQKLVKMVKYLVL